jgi:hypothetical protein
MLFKLGTLEWRVLVGVAGLVPVLLSYLFCLLRLKKIGSLDFAGVCAVTVAYLVSFLLLVFLSLDFERFGTSFSSHLDWAIVLTVIFFLPVAPTIVILGLALIFWSTPGRVPLLFVSLFLQLLHFVNLASILSGGEGLLSGL